MCLTYRQRDPKSRRIYAAGNLCLFAVIELTIFRGGFAHRHPVLFDQPAILAFLLWPSACSAGPRAAAAAAHPTPERNSYAPARHVQSEKMSADSFCPSHRGADRPRQCLRLAARASVAAASDALRRTTSAGAVCAGLGACSMFSSIFQLARIWASAALQSRPRRANTTETASHETHHHQSGKGKTPMFLNCSCA